MSFTLGHFVASVQTTLHIRAKWTRRFGSRSAEADDPDYDTSRLGLLKDELEVLAIRLARAPIDAERHDIDGSRRILFEALRSQEHYAMRECLILWHSYVRRHRALYTESAGPEIASSTTHTDRFI